MKKIFRQVLDQRGGLIKLECGHTVTRKPSAGFLKRAACYECQRLACGSEKTQFLFGRGVKVVEKWDAESGWPIRTELPITDEDRMGWDMSIVKEKPELAQQRFWQR